MAINLVLRCQQQRRTTAICLLHALLSTVEEAADNDDHLLVVEKDDDDYHPLDAQLSAVQKGDDDDDHPLCALPLAIGKASNDDDNLPGAQPLAAKDNHDDDDHLLALHHWQQRKATTTTFYVAHNRRQLTRVTTTTIHLMLNHQWKAPNQIIDCYPFQLAFCLRQTYARYVVYMCMRVLDKMPSKSSCIGHCSCAYAKCVQQNAKDRILHNLMPKIMLSLYIAHVCVPNARKNANDSFCKMRDTNTRIKRLVDCSNSLVHKQGSAKYISNSICVKCSTKC